MSRSSRLRYLLDRLLTVATVAASVATVAIGGARLVGSGKTELPTGSYPTVISDWQTYWEGAGWIEEPVDARVSIVVFSDYSCQFCAELDAALALLATRYPGMVRVGYHHYPLSERGRSAAIAVECASATPAWKSMHRMLFAQSDSFGFKRWVRFASEAGVVDTVSYAECLGNPHVAQAVQGDRSTGHELGVVATPTLLLDSVRIYGNPGLPYLERYVAERLSDNK